MVMNENVMNKEKRDSNFLIEELKKIVSFFLISVILFFTCHNSFQIILILKEKKIKINETELELNLKICQEVRHQALELKEWISKTDTKVVFLQEYLLCIEQ
jgi:hypothetical protein